MIDFKRGYQGETILSIVTRSHDTSKIVYISRLPRAGESFPDNNL